MGAGRSTVHAKVQAKIENACAIKIPLTLMILAGAFFNFAVEILALRVG